ncbi:helix-hairpin-helix domain-containing protein [Streptosporangium canum]|uniref:helix-hairpin-helix domain-containing protein n=1 Tax=Streptosporangium canum TaxID=324952 RepID=UPI0033B3D7B4
MSSPDRRDDTTEQTDLLELVNVGPAVARHLARAGITRTDQLAGLDPVELYDRLCALDGHRYDPCLLDTFMSAVEQAGGGPARPWWDYTAERKRLLSERVR